MPQEAASYHAALLKRPRSGTILERFINGWLGSSDMSALRGFLQQRADAKDATPADVRLFGVFLARQGDLEAAVEVFTKASQLDEKNPEVWLQRAGAEAKLSRNTQALESLAHITEKTGPFAKDANMLRARLLARTGQSAKAMEVLETLAKTEADNEDSQDDIVELLADEGLQAEATSFLQGLIERTKDAYVRVVRRLRMADLLTQNSQQDQALEAYEQCLADAAQDSWVEAEALAQIAQVFRRKDDLVGLKSHLAKLAQKYPQRAGLAQLRAVVAVDLDEGDEARSFYVRLLESNPGKVELRTAFIEMLVKLQRFDDAVTQCQELLARSPQDKELRAQLATLLYQAKRPGEAAAEVKLLVESGKVDEFELHRAARLYEGFSFRKEAKALYKRAVDENPSSTSAQNALASFLHANREKLSAVEMWKKQAASPAPQIEVLRVAVALSSRGESEAAFEVLRAREKEFGQDVRYLNQLITSATANQRHDLAQGWALQVMALAEGGESIEDALRQVKPVFRDAKVAEATIQKLKEDASLSIQHRCLLAELLEQTGDPEQADKVLAAAGTPKDQGIAQRLQARLYLLRQDFERAVQVLEKVAESGKDAALVEQLVSLHQRVGNLTSALKWCGEWKRLLPGSPRPWMSEARVLERLNRADEGVALLKQAARKFTDDVSVSSALAEAMISNHQLPDAEAIYLRLYEDAEDAAGQMRWAGLLADVAQKRGTLKDLLLLFQERQRSNRTSITPWLAIAEIHRRSNNYEGRRSALLEASRLKPKDIDLLHQIAKMDEDQGEWRKALDTLALAAPLDKTTKTRQRMAEVHLRYGDEETGVRMAFDLSGGTDMDPRDAENMITSLMARGNWSAAISIADPMLSHHPEDYRLRYLKMICLEEGDETERAISEAVALMNARAEVLTPSTSKKVTAVPSLVPEEIDPISQTLGDISIYGGTALRYKEDLKRLAESSRYRFLISSSSAGQLQFIPDTVRTVKGFVTGILIGMKIKHGWDEKKVNEVVARLNAAGHPLGEAIQWFEMDSGRLVSLKIILEQVEKHIDNRKLASLWVSQVQTGSTAVAAAIPAALLAQLQARGIKLPSLSGSPRTPQNPPAVKVLLEKIHDHYQGSDPVVAAQAAVKLWQLDPKNASALDKVVALAPRVPVTTSSSVYAFTMPFGYNRQVEALRSPEGRKLRDATLLLIDRYVQAHPEQSSWKMQIPVLHACVGDWEAFITSLESALAAQKGKRANTSSVFTSSLFRLEPINLYQVLSSIQVLPYDLVKILVDDQNRSTLVPMPEDDAKALSKAAASLTNPELRALFAWRTGDKEAFNAFANQQKESDKPVLWPLLVKAFEASDLDHLAAAQWLQKARKATTDRDQLTFINSAFVKAVVGLATSDRGAVAPFREDAQAALLLLRRATATSSYLDVERVLKAMEALDMKDEVEKQRQLLATVKSAQMSRFRSSVNTQPASSPYQIQEDLRKGKTATALPLAVRAVRQSAAADAMTDSSSLSSSYELNQWSNFAASQPKLADEIWKQVSTPPPSTLKAMHEQALMADVLGKSEEATSLYEKVIKVKPREAALRFRMAMLLARTKKDPKAAVEHLTAVEAAQLDSVAGNLMRRIDSSASAEDRIQIVRMVNAYLTHVKGKVDAGDLLWCQRAADLVISAVWRDGSSLPSMLDKNPQVSDSVRALYDERRRVFDEHCQVATSFPTIAQHLLPAMFALAVEEKKDTAPVLKQARATLTEMASLLKGSGAYYGDDATVESYNGSYNVRLWAPRLPEMLLHDARERGREKEFRDQIVPLIRQAYGTDAGIEYELRSKLWFCPESEFVEVVKELQKHSSGSRSSTDVFNPASVVRVWKTRGLSVSLSEFLTTYVGAQLRRGYGMDDEVIKSYAKGLVEKGRRDDLMTFLRQLMVTVLEVPESGWKEMQANHRPPRDTQQQPVQGSPVARIHQMLNLAGAIAEADLRSWMEVLMTMKREGFSDYNNFSYVVQIPESRLPEKAVDLMPMLERSPWLKDLPDFEPIQPGNARLSSAFDNFVNALQSKGRGYTAPLVQALQLRQEKQRSLGASLLIGRLVELTPDVTLALAPQVDAFASLSKTRQQEILKTVRSVWSGFDRDVTKVPALEPFAKVVLEAKINPALLIIASEKTSAVEREDTKFESALVNAVADAIPVDPAIARKALEKGVQMILKLQSQNIWNGTSWNNAYTLPTATLQKISSTASEREIKRVDLPSLENIGFALRLCEVPEQRDYLCSYGDGDWKWAQLLFTFWERSAGYREPREAARATLKELHRVLGEASPALLSEMFLDFGNRLPRWYRRVVLDEVKKIGAAPGELQSLAIELSTCMAMVDEPAPAIAFLMKRVTDEKLHPFTRSTIAATLLDRVSAQLKPAETRQCIEAILPLLENDWPGSNTILGPLLSAVLRSVADPEMPALTDRLRKAWLHRARHNKLGSKSGRTLEPNAGLAPQILEIFARGKDEKALRELYDGCPRVFQSNVDTPMVLARHQRFDLLKELFKACDGVVKGEIESSKRWCRFYESDKDLARLVDEAFKADARLAERARTYVVAAADGEVTTEDLKRNKRLKAEARRLLDHMGKDKKLDHPMIKHFMDSVPATEVLAAALLPEIRMDDVIRRAAGISSGQDQVSKVLELPVTFALSALTVGDDKPWQALLAAIKGNIGSDLWNALSFRVATVAIAQLRFHGWAKADPLIKAMRDLMALSPSGRDSLDAIATTHFTFCLLGNRMKDFDAWRQALPKEQVKAATPPRPVWMEYGLDVLPANGKEDGGKIVLAILSHPWSQALTEQEIDFKYHERWPKRLDDESLRAHTAEILKADPGNLAALDAVMNAWTNEPNAKPLLDAIKAVKPKCDPSKHARALERIGAIEKESTAKP
ncbi:MAG: tetratricopeptide repeat protein [Verrucomicrobiaceae bacterium]|nr:tetratricopeptide repeat protein [Verrucomicrobiaceae bacterium]